jgi:hypothetical protein
MPELTAQRSHLNSLRSNIQFTMETESAILSWSSNHQEGATLTTEVYRKPTHTLADISTSIITIRHT